MKIVKIDDQCTYCGRVTDQSSRSSCVGCGAPILFTPVEKQVTWSGEKDSPALPPKLIIR